MKIPKTVYVLGAGFSKPAGGPSQEELLREIWSLPNDAETEQHRNAVRTFLRDTLNVDETKVSLEDIYTPIDRCLAHGLSIRNKSESDLRGLREKISYLVSCAIQHRFRTATTAEPPYVSAFADYLVALAAVRADKAKGATDKRQAKAYDPFSIISLNWDILLDNALSNALERRDGKVTDDYAPFGVVDYCCYISSLESDDRRIRTGLWSLGCRGYNIKLLKIHGSMNWLQCPNCQQLFVGFDEKHNVINYTNPKPCRHCHDHGSESLLRGSLVMPTFLKDLSNFQIKLVWQNASVELMEADKLVFVGYSLPHADFEFRQLLSRMVKPSAEIEVVLWEGSPAYLDEVARYKQFFSRHSPTFEPKGVVEFVRKLCRQRTEGDPTGSGPNGAKLSRSVVDSGEGRHLGGIDEPRL